MERKPYKLTREGLEQLQKMIHELENKANEISRQRAEAAGVGGDWHDNFAFEQLIRDEQLIGQQIRELRKKLSSAAIINNGTLKGKVEIGTIVEIEFEDGERELFTLTDPQMADPSRGAISYASPLGSTILGAHEGDKKIYSVGKKKFHVKIVKIGGRSEK